MTFGTISSTGTQKECTSSLKNLYKKKKTCSLKLPFCSEVLITCSEAHGKRKVKHFCSKYTHLEKKSGLDSRIECL